MMRIGIDLGGTKIAGCLLDASGNEVERPRVSTPQGDYEGTIAVIVQLVKRLDALAGCECPVGIGYPGSVSPRTGLHRNANSTCLNGRDVIGDLTRLLGRDVRGANDANCLALSEAHDGAAADARVVFAAILGTGIGGGVVVDGRIVVGRNAVAGEWGHTQMPATDAAERRARPCYCGLLGCTEQFLAGPALEREYAALGGDAVALSVIAARAAAGEGRASRVIDLLCTRLADALAGVVHLIDPDVIVLGGGLSNISALSERVPALLRDRLFSDSFTTPLRTAVHGDASGVRGAARLTLA
jgi:fructokinase